MASHYFAGAEESRKTSGSGSAGLQKYKRLQPWGSTGNITAGQALKHPYDNLEKLLKWDVKVQ